MPKPKAKQPAAVGANGDGVNEDEKDGAEQSQHNEMEDDLDMERRRLMARNRAKLIALGISTGVMELQDLARKHTPATSRLRPKPPQSHKPPEPTRRSNRLTSGGGAAAAAGAAEPLLQLDEHGGAAVQGADAGRREARTRAAEAVDDDESGLSAEAIAGRAQQLRQAETSRLRELELEGLVDLSREAAVFVVIGSTGNHYTVRLSDAKRSCGCMDCRVRKRDCKHIRLILDKLQIQDNPSQWYEAVERSFHAAAAATAAADVGTQPLTRGSPAHGSPPSTHGSPPRRGGAGVDANADTDAGAGTRAGAAGRRQQAAKEEEEEEQRGRPGPGTALQRAGAGPAEAWLQSKGKGNSGGSKAAGKRARDATGADDVAVAGAPPPAEPVGSGATRETRAGRQRVAAAAAAAAAAAIGGAEGG